MRLLLLAACLAAAPALAQPHLATERFTDTLEVAATFSDRAMTPTTVTASRDGRVFLAFPRWAPDVPFTVGELVDGEARPYPDAAINRADTSDAANHFISVQAVVVGPADRLWVVDTGRPLFQTPPLAPKLVGIDLATGEVVKNIPLDSVTRPSSYHNDVRFDLRRGTEGLAFITDSSPGGENAIIVVDLASGESWRHLDGHPSVLADSAFVPFIEGQPVLNRPPNGEASTMTIGADGITLSGDGERLFYRPLSGRHLYSVTLDALADPEADAAATVVDYGDLGFASDGIESDSTGRLYLTNYEDNALVRFDPDAPLGERLETIAHDPALLWPDSIELGHDGTLYVTSNQLHRQPGYHRGEDLRVLPYVLFRMSVDAAPVVLR